MGGKKRKNEKKNDSWTWRGWNDIDHKIPLNSIFNTTPASSLQEQELMKNPSSMPSGGVRMGPTHLE